MIIYNIRKNGPYEKDKFILNVGQLHNKVQQEKAIFNDNHEVYRQLQALQNYLDNIYDDESDSGANQISLMLLKARLEQYFG